MPFLFQLRFKANPFIHYSSLGKNANEATFLYSTLWMSQLTQAFDAPNLLSYKQTKRVRCVQEQSGQPW